MSSRSSNETRFFVVHKGQEGPILKSPTAARWTQAEAEALADFLQERAKGQWCAEYLLRLGDGTLKPADLTEENIRAGFDKFDAEKRIKVPRVYFVSETITKKAPRELLKDLNLPACHLYPNKD